MQEIHYVTNQVLKKITPKRYERSRVEALSQSIQKRIILACQNEGIKAIVRLEGSVAKDTWLSENPDIDIFIRFPTSIPRKSLGEIGLKIARHAASTGRQVERYAEHPYLEVFIDDYRIDIVPCYDTTPGNWQSATDRTPYHTDYIKRHLETRLRGEVRLLKKFMQGIGVYGAELKIGGFSGYLCELLTLKYGSFSQVAEAFAAYNQRIVIDLEGFYAKRENELKLLFPEQLIIIDPVDKTRNAASAVNPQKLYTLIAASRILLEKPKIEFFYPPKPKMFSAKTLKCCLQKSASTVIFLTINQIEAVPDVLWGQLYRSKRALSSLLGLNDYNVLKDAVWSNEKNLSIFIFKLESQKLVNLKKHLGPPLERESESKKYLSKYSENPKILCGPYVENGRWVIEKARKNVDAVDLLKEIATNGCKNSGVADLISQSIKGGFQVLVDSEIVRIYGENNEFAVFLTEFVTCRPFWLEPKKITGLQSDTS